jgi:glucosamine-6-phosphate deaminase
MKVVKTQSKQELGTKAAAQGAEMIRRAIRDNGKANIVLATGVSQFEVLASLIAEPDIAWNKVTGFHLDEYIGMPITHPASFRKYLWERFVSKLPLPMAMFNYIDGEADPEAECARMSALIETHPIDVNFCGIGENAHLAFNDPPADFNAKAAYVTVNLDDEVCRRQQFGEGWFKSLQDVPRRAISMTCPQIMKARTIICSVPDRRKAKAVQAMLKAPISPQVPASILRRHEHAFVYLDPDSASLIELP